MHHHVVRGVAGVVIPVEDVAQAVAVIVDQVRVLPDQSEDVVVGSRAVDHPFVHQHQADGDQAAAADRSNEVGQRVPVDGAQPRNVALADVLVDHVGLLHAGLRAGLAAVFDLDDGGSARADPCRVALRGDLDEGGKAEFPVGGQRILLAVDRGLGNRQQVLAAVPQLEVERGALAVAGPAHLAGLQRLAIQRDRRAGSIHRLREIELDVAGRLQ